MCLTLALLLSGFAGLRAHLQHCTVSKRPAKQQKVRKLEAAAAWHTVLKNKDGEAIVCNENQAILRWDAATNSLRAQTSGGALVALSIFEKESGSRSHKVKTSIRFLDTGMTIGATADCMVEEEKAKRTKQTGLALQQQSQWLQSQKLRWRSVRSSSLSSVAEPEGEGIHPLFRQEEIASPKQRKSVASVWGSVAQEAAGLLQKRNLQAKVVKRKCRGSTSNDIAARVSKDLQHGKIDISHWRYRSAPALHWTHLQLIVVSNKGLLVLG